MSEINRRNFLCYLSAAVLIPLVGQEEVSAQIKNFKLTSPVNGNEYVWFGPLECRLNFRKRQAFPRIARVDYKANGTLIGSGFPGTNLNQNFYYSWFMPVPSAQGDNYVFRAEAVQAVTGNIVGTDTVNFRVIRLSG
jgi:hypothetical protein